MEGRVGACLLFGIACFLGGTAGVAAAGEVSESVRVAQGSGKQTAAKTPKEGRGGEIGEGGISKVLEGQKSSPEKAAPAVEPEKEGKSNPSDGADKVTKPAEQPLRLPVREGDVSLGLELPESENGKLRSFFSIEKLFRIGEHRVRLDGGFLEFFEDDGSLEFSIDLGQAVIEEDTRMLVAQEPVTVRTSSFELTGKGLKFNTKTRAGSLGGPVRMVIYSDSEDHE